MAHMAEEALPLFHTKSPGEAYEEAVVPVMVSAASLVPLFSSGFFAALALIFFE